jgi:hypothetical protein
MVGAICSALVCLIVGVCGFSSTAYPAWAFNAMRTCVYLSGIALGVSLIALFFPIRGKAIASLVIAFFLLCTAGFLTEGDPQHISYPTTAK